MGKEALRVSCVVPTSPHAVYMAWLDAPQHGAFAGGKALIDAIVGGRFSARDGKLTGTFVQLDLGRRIIQSWRTSEFPKGAPDSRLEVHFESVTDGTRITVLHSDIPEGLGERVKAVWVEGYFHPMRAYFGKMAIAADRASMARMAARASEPDVDDDEDEAPKPKLRKPDTRGPSIGKTAPPTKAAPPAKAPPAKAAPPAKSTKAAPPSKPAKSKAPAKTPTKAAKTTQKTAPKPAAKAAKKPAPKAAKKAAPKKAPPAKTGKKAGKKK